MEDGNTLGDYIIAFLSSARSTRVFHRILREKRIKRYKTGSVYAELSRLKKKQLINQNNKGWFLTEKGKIYKKPYSPLEYISSPFTKESPKNIIVSFDIPETKRHARRWLRNQLKIFGYTMLQRSLWKGPGPLPKECLSRIQKLGIKDSVKFFTSV